MTALAILLLVGAAAFGLSHRLRIPVIPLLLLSGMLLSAAATASWGEWLHGELEPAFLQGMLELGLTFLVFSAGIELNPKRFTSQRRAVWWVGLVQFAVTGIIGFSVAQLLGFDLFASLYLGIALSTSSTLVVLWQLRRWLRMFEPFGRMVTGVLLLQDLLMMVWIVVITQMDRPGLNMAGAVLAVIVLGVAAIFLQRQLMPWLLLRVRYDKSGRINVPPGTEPRLDEETLLLVAIAVLFTFAGGAHLMGLPPIVGAFMAGFSLSSFPLNGVVRSVLESLSVFFTALFFTCLGAIIVLPDPMLLLKGAALALVVLVITPPLVTLIAEWTGLSSRSAIESGLLLAQTSELALVLGLYGLHAGHITHEVFSLLVLLGVLTMTVTPFLARDEVVHWLLRLHPLATHGDDSHQRKNHIVVLGFGAGGMWVLKPLLKEGCDLVVVDDDPVVVAQLRKSGISCIRGDGADEKLLAKASIQDARLVVASMRRVVDAQKLLGHVKNVPVVVRVFEESEARCIRELGGIPILNSVAATETFIDWFRKSGLATNASP